jgi:hypothetical protein
VFQLRGLQLLELPLVTWGCHMGPMGFYGKISVVMYSGDIFIVVI